MYLQFQLSKYKKKISVNKHRYVHNKAYT